MDRRDIAVAPATNVDLHDALAAAVETSGGRIVAPADASALVWSDPGRPDLFPGIIGVGTGIEWIQLPYAGIESFAHHLDDTHIWTCGKGVYARPVAEHVLASMLSGLRGFVGFARATSWPPEAGTNLFGANVTILGGGGITEELIALLQPFGCRVTVVRRHDRPVAGAHATTTLDRLDDAVADALVVVVALALTDETAGIVDARLLRRMRDDAWLVNVGRGRHVVTDDLVQALTEGQIGGAVLDVTDPEPLPDRHPLWSVPTCLITPHIGNTRAMGQPLLAARVGENVRRWIEAQPLLGLVDPRAGY